jgi:hypothetical protein
MHSTTVSKGYGTCCSRAARAGVLAPAARTARVFVARYPTSESEAAN